MSQGKRAGRGISGLEKGRESPEVLAFAFLLAGFFLLPLLLASPFSPGGARERESSHVESARPGRIRWHPFGKEAFKLARSEDKPVLLSIVASWCHWCHVMEKETYGDREIARLINSSFIPIRVDRDERPDLDRHFQALLKAFSGESGLPLTAFLTPEGELFWGGTFFPPEDKGGQLGLRSLLPRLYRAYKERRGEVREVARTLSREVAELGARRLKATSLSAPALKALEDALISQTRLRHGGFGQREGPQFPRGPALQFLLTRHFRTGRPGLLLSARLTLDAMARGGIYDQLGGGFHRYAVDPGWRLPHLEKLTGPNAMLLTVYAEAYRATGEERYKRVAHGTADFALRELADRKGGGFFASLDSDSEPGDNGTYYRWRAAEVRALMPEPMARAAILHLGLSPADRLLKLDSLGRIPFIEKSPEEVASTLSLSPSRAEALLEQAKKRLLKARERRKPPSLDRRKYTDLNALMISAFLRASRALGREDLKSFALLSLEALIRRAYREGEGFCHLCSPAGPRVEGFLRDQAAAALALLDGYEVS
ncbi:MAG: thioredoxin domain-containing protein, partial [Nitrospinota bacterium]